MSRKDVKRSDIRIPRAVFETAESKEDLEDWLLARNPDFIRRLRRARAQDARGKCRPLNAAVRDLRTRS